MAELAFNECGFAIAMGGIGGEHVAICAQHRRDRTLVCQVINVDGIARENQVNFLRFHERLGTGLIE